MRIISVGMVLLSFSLLTASCKSARLRKEKAYAQLEQLQQGTLLVRLQTSTTKAERLRKAGYSEEAAEAIERQKETNEEIVRAFRQYYDYNKVYFFFSEDAGKVRDGQLADIALYNDEFLPVGAEAIDPPLFTASLGEAYDALYTTKQADGTVRKTAGTDGRSALVIQDRNLLPLEDPFPNSFLLGITGDNYATAVRSFQKSLENFELAAKKYELKKRYRTESK